MPKLVKLYIRNVLIGFGVAAAFVAMLLWFNVMNLWGLVTHSESGILAVFLLWFMHGIVFAGVQFAWAVMSLAEKKDNRRGGTPVVHRFEPALVPATERKSTRKGH
jgi:apolipoprotein N-acyltransferase